LKAEERSGAGIQAREWSAGEWGKPSHCIYSLAGTEEGGSEHGGSTMESARGAAAFEGEGRSKANLKWQISEFRLEIETDA